MTTCSERYEPHLSDKARSSEASRFSITKIWYAYPEGLREKFYQGVRRPIPGPLASETLAETCIACLYSNQNTNRSESIWK